MKSLEVNPHFSGNAFWKTPGAYRLWRGVDARLECTFQQVRLETWGVVLVRSLYLGGYPFMVALKDTSMLAMHFLDGSLTCGLLSTCIRPCCCMLSNSAFYVVG